MSTDIKGSMSIFTEARLDSAGEAAPSAWLYRELPSVRHLHYHPEGLDSFHPSPLADGFLHNVVVVIAVFTSKAPCVVVDVEVAVPVCDSRQGALALAQQILLPAPQATRFISFRHCQACQIVCCNGLANALPQRAKCLA